MANERPHPTIIMTPPTQADSHSTSHPRRPPAHRSVSLLHSPRKRPSPPTQRQSDSSSDDAAASRSRATAGSNSDSPSSLQPLGRGDSSGESSNAEKWFEQSNNQVRDHSASFADNDPPFFMRNSSSSETPPDAQQQLRQFLAQNDGSNNSLQRRTGLLHLGTDGSSTEDFRSVIDDLTVQNKKLKRRLKKYEKLHDSHLRDEKLFEVRIHGLPPEKKRELEETLRNFASSLHPNGFPANGYEGILPAFGKHNTASSATSLQNTDSAYASMSGQGSSAQSGNESRHKHMASTLPSRPQNIHSYLHHIPEGLLPQSSPANMTERAKKKLVARRLEHLFAGKGAAAGAHQHLLQQQEVSQMAARADRAAGEAQGQFMRQEGNREAHIMHRETKDPTDPKQDGQNASPDRVAPPDTKKADGIKDKRVARLEGSLASDQRPTRPLDLDPHRAQVPAENLQYMRHLGFSPPDVESDRSPEEGHGWIYLNLLINMAQLHTIHVTPDFVKKALAEYSSKFELSEDGRKVRWKGGRSVTHTSSSGGGSSRRTNLQTPDDDSPRKRPKLSHRETDKSMSSSVRAGAGSTLRAQSEHKLVYTPMFFHKDSTTEDSDSSEEEEEESLSSPYPARAAGDSSGMTSSGVRTTITKKVKKGNDGPIIFYNNARFCTDLSGDRKVIGNINAPPYTIASDMPVGKQPSPMGKPDEKRGPLAQAVTLPEPMDLDDNPIPDSMELSFPPRSPPTVHVEGTGIQIPMEVTGIGGTWPADHFAIAVESRHARVASDEADAYVAQDASSKWIPSRFADIVKEDVTERKPSSLLKHEIVRAKRKDLPPSDLPPAISFMPFGEESMGEDESEVDDTSSASPASLGAPPPSAAPQPVELHYASSDEEEDDDDNDDESDGSLDLLAAAREMDPEAIRAREREYDANMAERLAEEIPAGSSAATAGGGSGFNSPASVRGDGSHAREAKEGRGASASLKRNATINSVSS